jgi:hypothetical protein
MLPFPFEAFFPTEECQVDVVKCKVQRDPRPEPDPAHNSYLEWN